MDGRTDNQITRCPRRTFQAGQTFQAGGIKVVLQKVMQSEFRVDENAQIDEKPW